MEHNKNSLLQSSLVILVVLCSAGGTAYSRGTEKPKSDIVYTANGHLELSDPEALSIIKGFVARPQQENSSCDDPDQIKLIGNVTRDAITETSRYLDRNLSTSKTVNFADVDADRINIYEASSCASGNGGQFFTLRLEAFPQTGHSDRGASPEHIRLQISDRHAGDLKLLAEAIYTLSLSTSLSTQSSAQKCLYADNPQNAGRSIKDDDYAWSPFFSAYDGRDANIRYRLSGALGPRHRQMIEFFVTNQGHMASAIAFDTTVTSSTGQSSNLKLTGTGVMDPGIMAAVSRVPFGDNECVAKVAVGPVKVCPIGTGTHPAKGDEGCAVNSSIPVAASPPDEDAAPAPVRRVARQRATDAQMDASADDDAAPVQPAKLRKKPNATQADDAGFDDAADLDHSGSGSSTDSAAGVIDAAPSEKGGEEATATAGEDRVAHQDAQTSGSSNPLAKQINFKNHDGGTYRGMAIGGVPEGKGTMITADGDRYEGSFSKGILSGIGSYTWADGANFTGLFSGGAPNGLGTFKYVDGTVYTGEVKNGAPEGKGTLTRADGATLTGVWANGRFQHY